MLKQDPAWMQNKELDQFRQREESGLRVQHRNRGGLMTMDLQSMDVSMGRVSMVRCEVKSTRLDPTKSNTLKVCALLFSRS